MSDLDANLRPAPATYGDIAGMVDYALLAPNFSEEQIASGCEVAKQYGVAAVTVRPTDLALAARWVESSGVRIGSVVCYPHGYATTAVKLYETRDLLQRGAKAIETPLNAGKMISRQFQYIETELMQMAQECHRAGAILIVNFDLKYLAQDLRIIGCRIARRAEVDIVRAASLYGTGGYAMEHLAPLATKLGEAVRLDAGPIVRNWEDAISAHEAGCVSFQTTNPPAILDAWKAELARRQSANAPVAEDTTAR